MTKKRIINVCSFLLAGFITFFSAQLSILISAAGSELEIARAALLGLRLQDVLAVGVGRRAPNSEMEITLPKKEWDIFVGAVRGVAHENAFIPTQETYLSAEPEYSLRFQKRSGRILRVCFNTGKIMISEESSDPVQIHYSYIFKPKVESFKLLAELCDDAVTAGTKDAEHYMWTRETVLNFNNHAYLRIPYQDAVDCVNLIDRESRTCVKLDDTLAKRVIMAINMVYPIKTNLKPKPENLRMLQIHYKDGKKTEYWMHQNVFMYQNIQLGSVDGKRNTGIADLYYRIGLPDSV